MSENKLQTLAVLVENEAGVLSQISRLFSRKGYNIESLAVGTTHDPTISRITIEVNADDDRAELLCNQLRKMIPVYSVKLLSHNNSIRRELVLIKVKAEDTIVRNEVLQIAGVFRASVIDVSVDTLTIAVIGEEEKVNAIFDLLKQHGILEMVRTGVIAIERGARMITEETKEKDEFDFGKSVI